MAKVILVTGASSGLGKSLCERLLKSQHRVYGTSRQALEQSTSYPMLSLDVTDPESIDRAIRELIEREGRIDLLVNNAGVGMGAPWEKVSLESVRQMFDTNLFGALRLSQAVLPYMRKNDSGKIINISSIGSIVGLPYRGAYSASKAALDMFSETLRMEVKPFGIQVTTVLAGDMQTPIKSHWIGDYDPGGDPVYGSSYRRVVEAAGAEVSKGMPAEEVARQLEVIIETKNLRKAYLIGKPVQRLSTKLKSLLPASWFERIIMRYTNLES